ncbi:hypothetical protein DGM85_21350 [Xanthomonas phaseoli pv. phaseoli]|nr:hypothetical protein DGM93_21115 [Xanthomonas phaseoli pv. phaseoli]QWN30638.1 hypothetical protein DGM85_21350 [Xanthomonas phaseoli pv. phaseoli]QWN34765.1 hypothetical protein DGM81_20875 [Xanthomonas phaseoli pv. phaseoli]
MAYGVCNVLADALGAETKPLGLRVTVKAVAVTARIADVQLRTFDFIMQQRYDASSFANAGRGAGAVEARVPRCFEMSQVFAPVLLTSDSTDAALSSTYRIFIGPAGPFSRWQQGER